MSHIGNDPRQFRVHVRHDHHHHARMIEERSFEAAAVAYVEDLHLQILEEHQISVVVRDVDTGHEHCFRIDLDAGESETRG